ncbi:ERD (early-responsive to dehydration stress) family protein [Hibiscus syriacus]|uniref:ERD (Early-responsive to dehydration stress) family protein n=1 Tax=Hibiscus syriacus TaxID=106335 RepID=A0A6A2Z2P4_HIBSY|nr:ERD (early-responsive to dehydration stress) family protein [Hibiscus syriacus]
MSATQRRRLNDESELDDSGVFCLVSSVNHKLRAIAKRILWRKLCVFRAPRMVAALANGDPNGRIGGGWDALAKLMFFCSGCESTRHFKVSRPTRVILPDLLGFPRRRVGASWRSGAGVIYCSSVIPASIRWGVTKTNEDHQGIYRGVFLGFMRSKRRACLIRRQVPFEESVRCPYCGTRVWSMTAARLVPKSAAGFLGSGDRRLEYFVCVNGHLHGACWLIPLSSDEEVYDDGINRDACSHQTVTDGSSSSLGEDVFGGGPIDAKLVNTENFCACLRERERESNGSHCPLYLLV